MADHKTLPTLHSHSSQDSVMRFKQNIQKTLLYCSNFQWFYQCCLLLSSKLLILRGRSTPPLRQTVSLTVILHILYGLGITAGYHRLWTHRSYEACKALRYFLILLACGLPQHDVIHWARHHRAHHRYVDSEQDPYNIKRGFFYAHLGWYLTLDDRHWGPVDVTDIELDPVAQWQRRYYGLLIALVALIIPPLICHFGWGDLSGGIVYAVGWRMEIGYQTTFLINSLAHWSGRQPYTTGVTARDNRILGLFSAGEGHHNFHHRFPSDYRNGLRLPDVDISKLFIRICEKLRLAKNLVQTSQREIEQAKLQARGIVPASCEGTDPHLPAMSWDDYQHLSRTGSCVVAISGFVCDVTDFMHSHPGGPAALQTAIGTDATRLFNSIDHSPYASTLLSSLRIAVIASKSSLGQLPKKDE